MNPVIEKEVYSSIYIALCHFHYNSSVCDHLSEALPPRKALANGLFLIFICVT